MSRVTQKPEVRRDLMELADYIARNNLEAALRFFDAAEATFNFLADHREIGQTCNFEHAEAEGIRIWRIEGFKNHLVFYRPTSDGVDIVRVLHGARDIEAVFRIE